MGLVNVMQIADHGRHSLRDPRVHINGFLNNSNDIGMPTDGIIDSGDGHPAGKSLRKVEEGETPVVGIPFRGHLKGKEGKMDGWSRQDKQAGSRLAGRGSKRENHKEHRAKELVTVELDMVC